MAIVGAGIAGTYTAWKLRNTNQKITIYEYSNRVGGRMFTSQFKGVSDFNIELGAMRYYPASHPRLHKTIRKLGLKIRQFKFGYYASDNTLMYLHGQHMRFKNLGIKDTPYNLRPEERIPYNQLRCMQSVLAKYVSAETAEYIKAASGFRTDMSEITASFSLPWSPYTESSNTAADNADGVMTVKKGMGAIPKALLQEFLERSPRHKIVMNRHLTSIIKKYDGTYVLTFDKTVTSHGETESTNVVKNVCAKKVILAINRLALEQLDWQPLRTPYFKNIITNAVIDEYAGKVFLAYKDPWWRNTDFNFKCAISDTPLRQTYDYGTTNYSGISVLNAAYVDGSIVTLWNELKPKKGNSMNNDMMTVTNILLAELLNVSVNTIPDPVDIVAQMWNDYPFGGGWQSYKPGYNWFHIEREMVKPSRHYHVYVASNAFNGRPDSWWSAESALEAADLVLEHFDV